MRISVEEEFGLRLWYWDYPGTVEELLADWSSKQGPFNPRVGVLTLARGQYPTINDPYVSLDGKEDAFYAAEVFIRMHDPADSCLAYNGRVYPWETR